MSSRKFDEALAKRDASESRSLQQVFEDSIKRGLASDVASVHAQALKNAGDLLNPAIGEMKDAVKRAETKQAVAEAALKVAQFRLDGAQFYASLLVPLASQLPAVAEQLRVMTANNDAWRTQQVVELTAQGERSVRQADEKYRAASEKLAENERKFSQAGSNELLAAIKKLVVENNIPIPSFWDTPIHNPIFWTLFGWTPARAKIFTTFRVSYPEASEGFKQQAIRTLSAHSVRYPNEEPLKPIEFLEERAEFFTEAAKRYGCWQTVNDAVAADNLQRAAASMQRTRDQFAEREQDVEYHRQNSVRIAAERSSVYVSPTGYTGPHEADCCCPLCPNGIGKTLYVAKDVESIGVTPPAYEHQEPDINEMHELTPAIEASQTTEGAVIIEREKQRREQEGK